MFRIRVLVVIAVISSVVGAGALEAGASSLDTKASTVSVDKYVTSLCTNVSTWTSDVTSASTRPVDQAQHGQERQRRQEGGGELPAEHGDAH